LIYCPSLIPCTCTCTTLGLTRARNHANRVSGVD